MKKINIGIVLISVLILSGCVQEPTCKSPYIEYQKGQCCLDVNSNNICDNDEKPTCSDECLNSGCDEYSYYECIIKEDGCKDKIIKGKMLDNCGVECLTNNDCSSNQICKNNKCSQEYKTGETELFYGYVEIEPERKLLKDNENGFIFSEEKKDSSKTDVRIERYLSGFGLRGDLPWEAFTGPMGAAGNGCVKDMGNTPFENVNNCDLECDAFFQEHIEENHVYCVKSYNGDYYVKLIVQSVDNKYDSNNNWESLKVKFTWKMRLDGESNFD